MKWLTESALSLKIKLPVSIVVIIIITMTFSTLFTFHNFTTVVDSVKDTRLEVTAMNIGEHITTSINQAGRDMVMVASLPHVLQSVEMPPKDQISPEHDVTRTTLTVLFERILQAYGYYNAMYLVNDAGDYILGTTPTTTDMKKTAWFDHYTQAKQAGGFFVGPIHYASTINTTLLPIFLEVVYNGYGGHLVSSLNIAKIAHTAIQGVEHESISPHIFSLKDDTFIHIFYEGNIHLSAGPWIEQIKNKVSGTCKVEMDGKQYTMGFYHVPQTDIYAVTLAEPSFMTEPGEILRRTTITTNTRAVLIFIIFLILIIMPVMHEIAQLSLFAKKVTEDDHDASINSKRKDELGHLAFSLENMVSKLREMLLRSEAATKAKSDFLACMSHEIRTPMNGILGMTHLALQANPDEKQKDFLYRIDTAAKTLLGVINDILDFSKIEASKLDINTATFRISGIIASIQDMLEERALAKNLKLSFIVAPNVPDIIHSDPLRFAQICINLCSNAIKFTSEGEVTMRISLLERSGMDMILRVEVKDTGIGIAAEDQARIFDSFSQADGTTTRKYGGTGLGLTISRSLTHLLGGRMSVESELGKGSTFIFTFRAEQGFEADLEEKNATQQRTLPHMHVLLVEDNEINQEIALAILNSMGIEVSLATNGVQGVEAFVQGNFDLVFMDIQMPLMDGITAAQRIRNSQHPAAKSTPIIAMTAHAMTGDKEKSLEAGMNDHITKPIDVDELYNTLLTWGNKNTAPKDSQ